MRKRSNIGMPGSDMTIGEAFTEKREAASSKYHRTLYEIQQREDEFNGWIEGVRTQGIYVIDFSAAENMRSTYNVDIFRVLAAKCKLWGRPYIKCVNTGWSRIVVQVSGAGPERGLVSTLLLTAAPIQPVEKYNRIVGQTETIDPDIMKGTFYTDSAVCSWVTSRTVSIIFNAVDGLKAFNDWKEFCLTDRVQRIYLGI